MIFNRFIPPFRGGGYSSHDWAIFRLGKIGDFWENSTYPPPPPGSSLSAKNTLNLDEGHRRFPKTLLNCILSSTVDLYSIALLTEVLKAHVHYVVAGSHLPYISISYP